MKKLFTLIGVLSSISFCIAQTKVVINSDGTTFSFAPSPDNTLPLEGDFKKTITIEFKGAITPDEFKLQTNNAISLSTPSKTAITFIVKDVASEDINVTLEGKINGKVIIPLPIRINNTNIPKITAYEYFSRTITSPKVDGERYDRKGDRAYFFFDESGFLIPPAPVNIDADDEIIVFMAVPKGKASNYRIQADGEYKSTYVQIYNSDPIDEGIAQGEGGESGYEIITEKFGPFTSDVTISFFRGDVELPNKQQISINKLYNGAFGASMIVTGLAKPSFDILPISGTTNNTINKIDNGMRPMLTFNYIVYWKPIFKYFSSKSSNPDKSHITRGRDILKEADGLIERINPIIGLSINRDWKENYFFGLAFEFARGANVCAGVHLGKIQKLADDKFILGESIYTGTKDDIKLTNVWDHDFFVGVTLDTKIFNGLYKRR